MFAHGTKILRGNGGNPEVFTEVAGVSNITGPGITLDTEDDTRHDSPGGWEEVIATVLRTGEITFELTFNPTTETQVNLALDMTNRVKRNFHLQFPDANETKWKFSAYVTGVSPSSPATGKLTASITVKPSGQPDLFDDIDSYTVTFDVDDGASDIEGASVTFNNETILTDATGDAVFTGVLVGVNQAYIITKSGFTTVYSAVDVVDQDITETVSMS